MLLRNAKKHASPFTNVLRHLHGISSSRDITQVFIFGRHMKGWLLSVALARRWPMPQLRNLAFHCTVPNQASFSNFKHVPNGWLLPCLHTMNEPKVRSMPLLDHPAGFSSRKCKAQNGSLSRRQRALRCRSRHSAPFRNRHECEADFDEIAPTMLHITTPKQGFCGASSIAMSHYSGTSAGFVCCSGASTQVHADHPGLVSRSRCPHQIAA